MIERSLQVRIRSTNNISTMVTPFSLIFAAIYMQYWGTDGCILMVWECARYIDILWLSYSDSHVHKEKSMASSNIFESLKFEFPSYCTYLLHFKVLISFSVKCQIKGGEAVFLSKPVIIIICVYTTVYTVYTVHKTLYLCTIPSMTSLPYALLISVHMLGSISPLSSY